MLAVLPFLPALEGAFLHWDDRMLLVDNPRWRGPGGWAWILFASAGSDFGPYMPLTWASYRLDLVIGGLDPVVFHATNLVLHAVAAGAFLSVARRLLPLVSERLAGSRRLCLGASFAAAAIWAVHPLRTESVAWIAERRDVLSGALLLLSMRSWLDHVATRLSPRTFWESPRWWVALALFAASMLAKSTAVGWCLVLLLLDAWPLRRRDLRGLLLEKAPFALIASGVAAGAWWGQVDTGALAEVALPDRVVLAAHAAGFLVLRTVLPLGLRAHYIRPEPFDVFDPAFALPAVLAVAVTVAVLALVLTRPAPAVAWTAALLLLAPVSGIVPIGSHSMADRYTYLASMPLALLLAGGGAALLAARPRVAAGLATAAVFALGPVTGELAATWRDTRTLFLRVVELEPRNWFAHTQLGMLCEYEERRAEAVVWYRESAALRPSADACSRLGWALVQTGERQEAQAALERALAADPDHALARVHLGALRAVEGDSAGSEELLREALTIDPRLPKAHHDLALLLLGQGREAEAVAHLREAVEADPGYVVALLALIDRLEARGEVEDARDFVRQALSVAPSHRGARARAARLGVER